MRKALFIWMCLFAMMAAGSGLKAQAITITLQPGWTWISYTNAEAMSISDALGDFVPMAGDIIKSQYTSCSYTNGRWRGGLTHFIPGWGYMYYSKRTDDVDFVFSVPPMPTGTLTVTTSEPTNITSTTAVCGGSAVSNDGTSILMKGVCWATHPQPTTNDSYTEDGNGLGTFTAEMTELTSETVYYVRAYAISVKGINYGNEFNFTTLEGGSGDDHGYVDLGLPSGILWATCNVGADTPEEYGDYFAWGETQPKNYYEWSTYQHCMGSNTTLTKYCNNSESGYNGFTDNLTTLLPEDDAATANWGSDWRMPTREEWQELYQNTTMTWTTRNGVNGRLFTASNGNSLFLPAAGYRGDSSLYIAGSGGYYWSSSLYTGRQYDAWSFLSYSGYYDVSYNDRDSGFTVRPVRSFGQN